MRSYEYAGEPYKVEIERARLESGASWARVDGDPKLWVMPFGPVKRSFDELEKVAFDCSPKRLGRACSRATAALAAGPVREEERAERSVGSRAAGHAIVPARRQPEQPDPLC